MPVPAKLNLKYVLLEWCFPRVGSDLTRKHYTRLERLVGDKHSSLLRKFVNYDRKKFYDTVPRSERKGIIGARGAIILALRMPKGEWDYFVGAATFCRMTFGILTWSGTECQLRQKNFQCALKICSDQCHSAEFHSAKCHSAKCHSSESHSIKCHSTECHLNVFLSNVILLNGILLNVIIIIIGILLNGILLNGILLNGILLNSYRHYAALQNAEYCFAPCHSSGCHSSGCHSSGSNSTKCCSF